MAKITRRFCNSFFIFLQEKLRGSTPVNYFKKFKVCLDYCVEEHFLASNPAKGIRMPQNNAVTKEILSTRELVKLAKTPCRNSEVKRAFLFSCQSGLRWCDILDFVIRISISSNATWCLFRKKWQGILKRRFYICIWMTMRCGYCTSARQRQWFGLRIASHSYSLRILNEWTIHAGLRKHISFHCARHTFITLIMLGVPILRLLHRLPDIPAHAIPRNTSILSISKCSKL